MNLLKRRLKLFKKLNYIIINSGDTSLIFVIIILIFKSFFETLGIGLLYPFLQIALSPSKISDSYLIELFLKKRIIQSMDDFILYMGIFLVLFFLFGTMFSVYAKTKSTNFIWKLNSEIIKLSFNKKINEDLKSFKITNSNKSTHDVINEVHVFINGFLFNFIDLVPRIFLLIFFSTYLLIVNPYVTTLSISFLSIFYGFLLFFFRKKINKMSLERYSNQNVLLDYVNNSLRAIKDIKVNKFENYFVEKIHKPASIYSEISKNITVFTSIPKFIIEAVVLSIIVLFVIFRLDKENFVQSLPMLSVFSLSFIKLLPIVQGMFTNLTRMRFNLKSLSVIEKNIMIIKKQNAALSKNKFFSRDFESIELRNISYSYNKKMILQNQSLSINKGDFIIVYGESGSGKSTLAEILLGFLKINNGEIFFNRIKQKNYNSLSDLLKIGYVSQDIVIFEGNLFENITMTPNSNISNENNALNELVKFCFLEDIIDSLKGNNGLISEGGKNLSAGQKQRIIIARALHRKPEFLILDEATSALNSGLEEKIIKNILKMNITVLMITHNESLKKYSNNIVYLK